MYKIQKLDIAKFFNYKSRYSNDFHISFLSILKATMIYLAIWRFPQLKTC